MEGADSLQLPAALTEAARASPPRVALVLGSGLGQLARKVAGKFTTPFDDIPGLAAPSVAHHRGMVTLGDWMGKQVLVFEGRLHYYEGHAWERVEMLPRIAAQLGARTLILTNAAGGIHPSLRPGSLMAIRDHIEWNRPYCWRFPGPGALGTERPPPYSSALLRLLVATAVGLGMPLHQGVYAAVTGPSYETPAEIRALRTWGADAVGMSTTREALKAQALGLDCAAISCITNVAAGLSDAPITHEEVGVNAAAAAERFTRLLEGFVRALPNSNR